MKWRSDILNYTPPMNKWRIAVWAALYTVVMVCDAIHVAVTPKLVVGEALFTVFLTFLDCYVWLALKLLHLVESALSHLGRLVWDRIGGFCTANYWWMAWGAVALFGLTAETCRNTLTLTSFAETIAKSVIFMFFLDLFWLAYKKAPFTSKIASSLIWLAGKVKVALGKTLAH